jgi:hypothetical protein
MRDCIWSTSTAPFAALAAPWKKAILSTTVYKYNCRFEGMGKEAFWRYVQWGSFAFALAVDSLLNFSARAHARRSFLESLLFS